MSMRRAAIAALVLMGIGGSARAADESTLRWKFQKGDVLKYEFKQKNDLNLKAAGQELKNVSELTFNVRWEVKSVADDGAAKVTMKVERVRAHVKNGQQTIDFDSNAKGDAEPAAAAISTAYREVVGPDYLLTVDSKGKVVEAKVPDAVKESLKGSPFQAIADGGSVLSDSGVKNMFLQVIPVFPDKPVAQGGKWVTLMELPTGPLTVKLKETYTLAKSGPDGATIEATLSTKMEPVAGVPLTVEMKKETGDATFTFDAKAGRITKSVVHQTMDVSLKGSNGELDQNIVIEVSFAIVP